MAAKKGDGLLMVYCDVAAEHEEEFNRWYNEEHIPERLAIPGVLNAARYQAVDGAPKYLACYELASPDAWYAEAWQQWLRNPTPWSSGCLRASSVRHISGTCIGASTLKMSGGDRTGGDGAGPLGRTDVRPGGLDAKFNDAYNNERLPLCRRIPGYIRARRFEAVMGEPKYTTVHEMASLDVWKSQAWDDWRTAVTPVWNSEIRPHMVHAAGSPGVYQRIFPA